MAIFRWRVNTIIHLPHLPSQRVYEISMPENCTWDWRKIIHPFSELVQRALDAGWDDPVAFEVCARARDRHQGWTEGSAQRRVRLCKVYKILSDKL